MRIGGETTTYGPGESFLIGAGVPHEATVHAGYEALMIFDAPDRYSPRT